MNKAYLQKLANRIKELRSQKGLTQDDLASESVSRGMISLLETVRTDITKFVKVLDCNIKDLFDFD